MYNLLTDRDKQLVEFTIQRTLESIGFVQPQRISQNQAYKKYGQAIVQRWQRQQAAFGKVLFERRGASRNSTKSALIEDLERIYQSEKNIAIKFKQNLYK